MRGYRGNLLPYDRQAPLVTNPGSIINAQSNPESGISTQFSSIPAPTGQINANPGLSMTCPHCNISVQPRTEESHVTVADKKSLHAVYIFISCIIMVIMPIGGVFAAAKTGSNWWYWGIPGGIFLPILIVACGRLARDDGMKIFKETIHYCPNCQKTLGGNRHRLEEHERLRRYKWHDDDGTVRM